MPLRLNKKMELRGGGEEDSRVDTDGGLAPHKVPLPLPSRTHRASSLPWGEVKAMGYKVIAAIQEKDF